MKAISSLSIKLLVITLMLAACISPIKDVSYIPSSMITIREGVKTIRFTLYRSDKPVKPKKGKHYFWYGTNKIHSNEGDYYGRLLDGKYMVFDVTGGLIESGNFDKGLKVGHWVTWNPSGEIHYTLKYRNGVARDTIHSKWLKKIFVGKSDTSNTISISKKQVNPNNKKKVNKEKDGDQK
jgi:hypothetical protein